MAPEDTNAEPTYPAAGGEKLPYSSWLPESGAPDIILIGVHGISGAASDFRPLGGFFQRQKSQHGLYALELRGQGNDPDETRRGDIDRPDLWYDDLYRFTDFVSKRHPGVPIVWHGESLGSIITLNAFREAVGKKRSPVAGLVLGSPIVKIDGRLPFWKYWCLKGAAIVAPRVRIPLESIGGEEAQDARVVASTTHKEQAKITEHALNAYTLRLLSTIGSLIGKSGENARVLDVPTLVLYGGKDIFAPADSVEAFFKAVASKSKEKRFYPDSHHLLMFDNRGDEVMAEITNWLGKLALQLRKQAGERNIK